MQTYMLTYREDIVYYIQMYLILVIKAWLEKLKSLKKKKK